MEFLLGGARLTARPSGALWWGARRLLCVSDLHLGKSQRMARRGGSLLPPYEVAETLARLEADIAACDPKMVVCLGDSFDDLAAGAGLDEGARRRLSICQAGREWVWIEGNHDAGPLDLGGTHRAEWAMDGLVFRHIARADFAGIGGEVSGHYHPKMRLAGQSLPAFLLGGGRVILPAFGTYTGGMLASTSPLPALMGAKSRALVCSAGRVLAAPLR